METNHTQAVKNTNGTEPLAPGTAPAITVESFIISEKDNPLFEPKPKNGDSSDDFSDDEDDDDDGDDDDKKDDDDDNKRRGSSCVGRAVSYIQLGLGKTMAFFNATFHGHFSFGVFALLYFAYFGYAMYYRFGDEGSIRLLWCTVLGVVIAFRQKVWSLLTKCGPVRRGAGPKQPVNRARFFLRWLFKAGLGAFMVYVIVDVGLRNPLRLISLSGIVVFILIAFLFSSNPSKVNWHTIYWSLGLQFILAVAVMRWEGGKEVVLWINTRLDGFFANAKPASALLFGETYTDHYFVFGALPILLLTSSALSMLYHVGAMQLVVNALGSALCFCLGTSTIESTGVAASIFLEGAAALLSIRPYLPTLGKSELFALTSACLSSVGGAYLAMLSQIGVRLEFMLPAMVMSAPANFTICKLVMPETKKPRKVIFTGELPSEMQSSTILEAAQNGAIAVVNMLVNIVVSAFSFFSLICWVNTTLTWFGLRVGVQQLTIEKVLSYLFFPVSYLMGIEVGDCRRVAMLMGLRISTASLVSMLKMLQMVDNRDQLQQYSLLLPNASLTYLGDHVLLDQWNVTLVDGVISKRSEAIATYALCGFSGVVSLFITTSIMGSLLPKRHAWLARKAFPLLIAGNFANFLVGCFAGLLVDVE